MDYVGSIFRPPSEASSLLIQITVGCSHNRCTYCSMYRGERFRTKPWEVVAADIREAAQIGPRFRRVFLCDGDALILSTPKLLRILTAIHEQLPWVERVGTYGDSRSVLRKSASELAELRDAGLAIVYHGVESGDDEVLARIEKGGTRAEAIETAARLREAGLTHSVIVLLGVGGVELSAQHAANTATALTEMDPPFAAALTVTVIPGTPLYEAQQAGRYELPDPFGMLEELEVIVRDARLSACRFSSNHASNYLPVRSDLPGDRGEVLRLIRHVLAERDPRMLRPEHLRGL